MESLIIVSSILGAVYLALWLSTYLVYGRIIGDSKILKHIEENKLSGSYNPYNTSIITIGRFVITNIPMQTISSKYTIQNAGVRISRFSKSHKIIDEIYKARPSKIDTLTNP